MKLSKSDLMQLIKEQREKNEFVVYYDNCRPAIAESKDYKRLAKKWLNEDKNIRRKPYRRPAAAKKTTWELDFFALVSRPVPGARPDDLWSYPKWEKGDAPRIIKFPNSYIEKEQKLMDEICKFSDESVKELAPRGSMNVIEVINWGVQVTCPKVSYMGPHKFFLKNYEMKCHGQKGWNGKLPWKHLKYCGFTLAESKDFKRLSKKWLSEKRKISARKISRDLLSEAKSVLRKEVGDLNNFVMHRIKKIIAGENFGTIGAEGHKLYGKRGTDSVYRAFKRSLPAARGSFNRDGRRRGRGRRGIKWHAHTATGDVLPPSLQKLGLKNVDITFIPDEGVVGAVELSGHYNHDGELFSRDYKSRVARMGPTIQINVHYNPQKIGTPEDFRKFLSEVSEELQEFSMHELRHFWQATPQWRLKPEHRWTNSPRYRSDTPAGQFLYLKSPQEVDSYVRGLANRAKKSKGKWTFEALLKRFLQRRASAGYLTKKQYKHILKLWMDHARRQIPCATDRNGKFINPKGCGFSARRKKERKLKRLQNELKSNPQMRKQLQKEMDMLRDAIEKGAEAAPKGKVTKYLKKLPLVGRLLVAGGIYWAIDSAYEKGGWEGVGKELISVALDMTPWVGEIKGSFEALGDLLTRKGRTALQADPAFFSASRGKL